MDFKFDNLRALVAIQEQGTFSQAAEYLKITQSALSKRIQVLESQVNHRVVDRNTRSAKLTAAGEELVLMARQMEKMIAGISQNLGSEKDDVLSGSVRIAASSSHLRPVLLPRLASLVQKNPNVHLNVLHGSVEEVEAMLLDLRVDFILTDRKVHSTKAIRYYKLGDEKFVVIRPKIKANRDKFLGTVPSDPTFHQFMEKQKKSLRPKDLEKTFLGDVYSIVDAVSLGFGSAIVPEHVVDKKSKAYSIDENYESMINPFFLAHVEQPVLSKLEKTVISEISG